RPLRKPGTTDDDHQGEKVTIAAGATANVTLTVEDASGTITGKVLDGSGAAVTDAFLRAVRESDAAGASSATASSQAHWGWGKQPAVTGPDGTFTIDDLSPGNYTVLAYRQGGTEAKLQHVAVGTSVTLTIAKGGSLAGTITTASGDAPRDVAITVRDRGNGV